MSFHRIASSSRLDLPTPVCLRKQLALISQIQNDLKITSEPVPAKHGYQNNQQSSNVPNIMFLSKSNFFFLAALLAPAAVVSTRRRH